MSVITDLTAVELADSIARKNLSPVEVLDAFLERSEAHGDRLAAFTHLDADHARHTARGLEQMAMKGDLLGPLHGVPVLVKDNIDVAGRLAASGSKILADRVAPHDAAVTTRLKHAGANIFGNTNMHEFAWGATSENPHYGTVRNPWNEACIASGSSGGSGAAVAARLAPVALGTDTGGSIRLPSSATGITGLRPTIGRVSSHGIFPLAWSMDTCGPMTRDAADNALVLAVLAGADPRDPGSSRAPLDDYVAASRSQDCKGLRIGVVGDYAYARNQPRVTSILKESLETFTSLGAEVEQVSMPLLDHNIAALMTIESSEPTALHHDWLRQRPEDYGDNVRFILQQGALYTAADYLLAQRYRRLLREQFLELFDGPVGHRFDAFAFPTIPFSAPVVGTEQIELEPGFFQPTLEAIMRYTGVASVTGLPAISLPGGFDDRRMPVGIQLIGAPNDEATLYRLSGAFQAVTDYHLANPIL